MSTSSSGAPRAAGWVSCCLAVVFLGCTQAQPSVTLKLPEPKPSRSALGGTSFNGAAQWDAPIVDMGLWTGSPIGTGTYSLSATPPLTGGPAAIAASESGWQYVVIGNFSSNTGTALAVLSDLPWVLGSQPLDGVHRYALLFDVTTGDAIGQADSGSVTLTAAGAQLNQRVTGTVVGSFVLYPSTPPPACQTSADCAANEVCQSGVCIVTPVGCTSNAQCLAGETCQGGVCVPRTMGCTSTAQCAAGEVCQGGVCIQTTAACTSNAQCSVREVCQAGACVPIPSCTSNAQCAGGWVCQAGQCIPNSSVTCSGQQGSGGYSGAWGGVANCSAAGAGSVVVSQAQAWFEDSGGGSVMLVVADPNSSSAGVVFDLSMCPGAAGNVTLQPGQAMLYLELLSAAPDTAMWLTKQSTGGTLTFTSVGAVTAGTFLLNFSGGGAVTGQFTVQ